MVKFKGRLSFRQYMPNKPTEYGIKLCRAADSANGYMSNFDVYLGKKEDGQIYHGLGYDVVMRICRPFYQNHHIFDNFFSSPKLFIDLLQRGTYACSTVRVNRKALPLCAKAKLKQQGELVVRQCGNLVFTKWLDKREVSFLRMFHH